MNNKPHINEGLSKNLPQRPKEVKWIRLTAAFQLLLCLLGILALSQAQAQIPIHLPNHFSATDRINAFAEKGDTLFLAGAFESLAPVHPFGAISNLAMDQINYQAATPNNEVFDAIADGQGGFYVGGSFTQVGGLVQNRVAHYDANGQLLPLSVSVDDGHVESLALSGNILFLGGSFTSVDGQARTGLAAYDLQSASLLPWNPVFTSVFLTPWVGKLLIHNQTLYVGGFFNQVNAQPRTLLAAFDLNTLNLNAFAPSISGFTVEDMLVHNDHLYFCGDFTSVQATSRKSVAAINLSNNQLSNYAPIITGTVSSMVFHNAAIYLGGSFNASGSLFRGLLSSNPNTGSFNLNWVPGFNTAVIEKMAVINNTLWVGASQISYSSGSPSKRFVALDLNTAQRLPSSLASDANINTFCQSNNQVFVGGKFKTIGTGNKNYLAAISKSTGAVLAWAPFVNKEVDALLVDGNTLYVGGRFTEINGNAAGYLAAFDFNAAGNLLPWNPNMSHAVYSLAQSNQVLYAGGNFTQANGQARNRLAAFDKLNGALLPWNPGANAWVLDLKVHNNTLYVGGQFTQLSGIQRNYAGGFDLTTGLLANWNPNANGIIRSIAPDGLNIYIAGDFTNLGGHPNAGGFLRLRLAEVDALNGVPTSWEAADNTFLSPDIQSVNSLAILDSTLVVVGEFTKIGVGGALRLNAALLSKQTGMALNWNPFDASASLSKVYYSDNKIYISGNMDQVDGQLRRNLAVFQINPAPVCPTHQLNAMVQPTYSVALTWNAIAPQHRLQWRTLNEANWSSALVAGTQRFIQNLAPGDYEARVYGVGLGDTSCLVTFNIGCANNISYASNVFQAGYLDALPGNSARVSVFNVSGGKSLYSFELENLSNNGIQRADNRRNYTFNQLAGGNYVLRVYDAFNCQADSVTPIAINALDTAYIPNLISAVNSSPNGFRPIWNHPRQNGALMPGILSYQLRVRNETDNQLVDLYTGIADTFFHVNNLTPGKLYRFNVRSRYNPGDGARNSAFSVRRDRNLGLGGNKTEGATGVEEYIRIFPNPATDAVYVECPIGSHIKLLDLQGRLLKSLTTDKPVISLDLGACSRGTYILEIDNQGQLNRQKVVKP